MSAEGRGANAQWKSLQIAHRLLKTGWGLNLGLRADQKQEIHEKLPLVEVRVRFFPKVMGFILEGEKRHPKQDIELGPKGDDGKPAYVDYSVKLPQRSLQEFSYWVYRFMENAQFIYPKSLAEQHQQAARVLSERYL